MGYATGICESLPRAGYQYTLRFIPSPKPQVSVSKGQVQWALLGCSGFGEFGGELRHLFFQPLPLGTLGDGIPLVGDQLCAGRMVTPPI